MNDIEKEIVRLTQIWYEYVNLEHHKDRDCHFYIEVDYAYGEAPVYKVFHQGYVDKGFEVATTRESAHQTLLNGLRNMIKKNLDGARAASERRNEGFWDEGYAKGSIEILERA